MRIDRFYPGWQVVKAVLMGVVVLCNRSVADEPKSEMSEATADRWRLVLDEISTSFQVNRDGKPLADVRKSTVLKLWDPTSYPSPRLGGIYLWTEKGRPVLIGTVMTGTGFGFREAVSIIYEFHSLDSKPIQVEQREVLLDCPSEGIKWLPIEGNQSPNQSRVHRMIQMRDIARSFKSTGTTLKNTVNVHKLLPSPIYRYANETESATDGAIFAVCKATDPVVYILIEARNDQWWVAFARSSVVNISIERNDQLFYTFDPLDLTAQKLRGNPFYINWDGEQRAASSVDTKGPVAK